MEKGVMGINVSGVANNTTGLKSGCFKAVWVNGYGHINVRNSKIPLNILCSVSLS